MVAGAACRASGVGVAGWGDNDRSWGGRNLVALCPVIPAKAGIQVRDSAHGGSQGTAFRYTPPMTYGHRRREPLRPCVYILASQRNGTLYTGVTSNLPQRVWQHKQGLGDGFTGRYAVHTLVWYEQHETMMSAITREKASRRGNAAGR